MRNTPLFLIPVAAFALTAAAHAQVLSVPNPDFHTNPGHDAVSDVSDPDAIQFVTETHTGPGHYGDAGVMGPDGMTSGFVNTDDSGTVTLTNDLTSDGANAAPTFTAGLDYTLTLHIGINPTNTNQNYDRTGNITFGLLAGGNVVGVQTSVPTGAIVPTVDSNNNPQVTFDTFTFSYLATSADNGKAIGIQINDQFGAGSQTEFTEATLTAAAVPEPGTWAMLLGGIAALALSMRFRNVARL